MKFRISLSVLIVLVLVNLILFSGLIYIGSLVAQNSLVQVKKGAGRGALPYLANTSGVQVNSKAYIIYDADSHTIIAGKNQNLRFAPASTAKIMTATIAISHYNLNQILTAKNLAKVPPDSSKMGLVDGEQISVEDLLYGMMLPSGNDAAYTLAENYPNGSSSFISDMNKKAKELDLNNTYFFDPDGYDDQNYTTAYDLARLGAYAIKNQVFAKIVGTKNKIVYDVSGKFVHQLNNLNALLGHEGVTGIKTGTTPEAGEVLVTSISENGHIYIIVVLNSPDRFLDTQNIIDEAIRKIKLLFY